MKFKGKINVFKSEIFNKYIYKNINNKNIKNIYKTKLSIALDFKQKFIKYINL